MRRASKMRMSDFLVGSASSTGGMSYDFSRLARLTDEEFVSAYDSEMKIYIQNHLSITGGLPKCGRCFRVISEPNDLIRYYGMNLHGGCFVTELWTDKYPEMKPEHEEYFDRILRLRMQGKMNVMYAL